MGADPNDGTDAEVGRLRGLSAAVVADALDRVDLRSQVMSHRMRPVVESMPLAGRAYPVQAVPTDEIRLSPYDDEIAAVDAIPPGAVVVLATGGLDDVAIWGELLCTRALARGACGVVVDGAVRDLEGLRRLGVPTFATAISPADSSGRLVVTSSGRPVVCAGVTTSPGDLVLGDLDGVVVVPAAAAADVLAEAEAKRAQERLVREALRDGASIAEVYARHGVL